MPYNMTEAVEAGAALLDEHEPRWFERVNLTTLDVSSTMNCVLGQIFDEGGDPDRHPFATGWGLGMVHLFGATTGEFSIPNGFEIETSRLKGSLSAREEAYAALTEVWRTLIENRLSA